MAEVMSSTFSELEMGIASAAPDQETRYAATGESAYDAVWGNIMLVEPVLAFLSIEDQLRTAENLSCVARAFYVPCQISDPSSPLWRSFVQNLCAQRKLWVPDVVREGALLADASGGWRSLFEDLWPLRNQFASETQGAAAAEVRSGVSSKFRVATFCRFRTACARTAAAAATAARGGGVTGVVLPLHQRVALLRRSHPELLHKEAVAQVIATQRAQKQQQQQHAEEHAEGEPTTQPAGLQSSIVSVQSGAKGSVLAVSPGCGLRGFEFGHVFDESTAQSNVYEQCGLRLVMDLANGVNGALILYGQTGAGKTHTMFGPPRHTQETRGLAPRVAEAAVDLLAERRRLGLNVRLKLSYVELFGNEVTDLLEGQRVAHPEASRVLKGEFELDIETVEDVDSALARGEERKRCAETAMNDRSTRAHTLLVFRLEQSVLGTDALTVSSSLFLADLGGSERVTKSRANEEAKSAGYGSWSEYYESRRRLSETNNINQGLLALKRCIQALDERQKKGTKSIPVPYRDSRLTEVLEPALGGLARTSIVVCCSPEAVHAEETVQTLRFGEMCSCIEHVRAANADTSSGVAQALRQLDEQVQEVEGRIREKERWELRQSVRTDVVDANDESTSRVNVTEEMELGGLGAVEILPDDATLAQITEVQHAVWGQVLVGAEEEHAELEALLDRRRQLLGEA
mmetsp:Transcript_49504/g.141946  ORF Transcript_49504/g.141946 Transcript_49504/m.141946 type:complete len:688 (+) Transcript_49504:55-2118(+)